MFYLIATLRAWVELDARQIEEFDELVKTGYPAILNDIEMAEEGIQLLFPVSA